MLHTTRCLFPKFCISYYIECSWEKAFLLRVFENKFMISKFVGEPVPGVQILGTAQRDVSRKNSDRPSGEFIFCSLTSRTGYLGLANKL